MIFTFLFVFFLSISSVKNNQVDSPKSVSKEVHPAPDESTKLFHELKASRQREKDLNETIENILEEMTQMKNSIHQLEETILHLEGSISDVASEATLNADNIDIVADTISLVKEDVSSVNSSLREDISSMNNSLKEDVSLVNYTLSLEIRSLSEDLLMVSSEIYNVNSSTHQLILDNKREIEDNQESITELSLHGQWCAYQDGWTSGSSIISYDSIFFEDSNINNNALNVGTGETLIKYEASNNNIKSISYYQTKAMLGTIC